MKIDERILKDKFQVSEIFSSIQGEGKYAGHPSKFVRLCFCHRSCSFCDTEFEAVNKLLSVKDMAREVRVGPDVNVVWTGGEPMLHWELIQELRKQDGFQSKWHLETAGDHIGKGEGQISLSAVLGVFQHVVISPKNVVTAKRLWTMCKDWGVFAKENVEIKVVTDIDKVNRDLIPYATSLMPLSTTDEEETLMIKKKVACFCIAAPKIYCPRLQVDLWGYEARGV